MHGPGSIQFFYIQIGTEYLQATVLVSVHVTQKSIPARLSEDVLVHVHVDGVLVYVFHVG